MSDSNLRPFPGFVILEPYELKRKIGGYSLPTEEGDNTPQIGRILDIGNIPIEVQGKFQEWYKTKSEMDHATEVYMPFKIGMVVAYKKYQDFPIQIGTKKYIAVAFEHLLFQITENE